jgi:hypothetical protein
MYNVGRLGLRRGESLDSGGVFSVLIVPKPISILLNLWSILYWNSLGLAYPVRLDSFPNVLLPSSLGEDGLGCGITDADFFGRPVDG